MDILGIKIMARKLNWDVISLRHGFCLPCNAAIHLSTARPIVFKILHLTGLLVHPPERPIRYREIWKESSPNEAMNTGENHASKAIRLLRCG